MMLEPAQRAGDAPRTAPEQGPSPESPLPPAPPAEPVTRLSAPTRAARLRTEREQWWLRRSVERQLHDGAALRISALTLQLGLFRHRAAAAECDIQDYIDGLQDELHAVLQELRDVAARIYPPLLDEAGLGPALREAADRIDVPVRVDAPEDRFGPGGRGRRLLRGGRVLGGPAARHVPSRRRGAAGGSTRSPWTSSGSRCAMPTRCWEPSGRLDGVIDVAGGPRAGTITMRIPCE